MLVSSPNDNIQPNQSFRPDRNVGRRTLFQAGLGPDVSAMIRICRIREGGGLYAGYARGGLPYDYIN